MAAESYVFSNDYCTINKKDSSTYSCIFKNIESFTKQQESYFLDSYISGESTIDERTKQLTLSLAVESIEPIVEILSKNSGYLAYNPCVHMIESLYRQFNQLQKKGYCYGTFNMRNIVVINGVHYVYLSDEDLLDVDSKSSTATVNYPLNGVKQFMSPEQRKETSLPYTLSSNSWLYSLASMVLLCLTGNKNSYEKQDYESKVELLEPIEQLPLYYTLLRCFHEDPKKRTYLYI